MPSSSQREASGAAKRANTYGFEKALVTATDSSAAIGRVIRKARVPPPTSPNDQLLIRAGL